MFCGLVAGLFALMAPVGLGTDLLTAFLKLWGQTPGQQLLGTVAWYLPVGAAVLGGLLAFVAPGLGALMLLGAGLGWIGIGAFDTSFFRLELLAPGVLGVAGSALAFAAGELELRRRRAARRQRRESLRDYTEDEARAREAAYSMDPLTMPREEAPPRPSREIPLTLEDVVPADRPEPRRRSETIWPDAPSRPSMFDRDGGDRSARRSLFERPAARAERPPPDRRERDRDYREGEREYLDDAAAPRRNMFVWVAAANALVLIVLIVAVGYMMAERSSAPSNAGVVAEATESSAVDPTPVPPPALQPPTVAEASGEDDRLTPNLWPALALPGSEGAELPMAAADGLMAGTFSDPFAYCEAVKTVDYVDNRYVGPHFTLPIADALRVPSHSARDRVSWRCVDGVVYACASFDWPVCAMTPTAQEMLDYCQRNPGVTRLLAPNGTWACEGTRPRLPEGASWPVDARGFFPKAWIPVLPPQQQPAG